MKVSISQAHVRIFRAVEGAVRNAAHGHPRWRLTEVMARSIAKRATGTLTACWPDVLAAHSLPSESAGNMNARHCWPPLRRSNPQKRKGGVSGHVGRSPLPSLWERLAFMVGEAKRAGNVVRAEALIDVLRIIAAMQKARAPE